MKKATLITIIILALLVSMLPMSSAFAAKPTPMVKVTVFNHTKGTINMSLTDFNGFHYYATFANSGSNTYSMEVPEGKYYSYYIMTPCDTLVGTQALTRNWTFDLYCNSAISDTVLIYHAE
ncbi:MAG: hypothetical protein WCP19_08815 [Chloroflexota bacterium]